MLPFDTATSAALHVTSFDEIVRTSERTCSACPTIYEGRLRNGDSYYVRARYGGVRFENESKNLTASRTMGGDADGYISYEEFQDYLVELHAETLQEQMKLEEDAYDNLVREAEALGYDEERLIEHFRGDDLRLEEYMSYVNRYDTSIEDYLLANVR